METLFDVVWNSRLQGELLMAYTYYWEAHQKRLLPTCNRRELPVIALTEGDKADISQLLYNDFLLCRTSRFMLFPSVIRGTRFILPAAWTRLYSCTNIFIGRQGRKWN